MSAPNPTPTTEPTPQPFRSIRTRAGNQAFQVRGDRSTYRLLFAELDKVGLDGFLAVLERERCDGWRAINFVVDSGALFVEASGPVFIALLEPDGDESEYDDAESDE
jgi:hypothetical protein